MNLFRRRTVAALQAEALTDQRLHRALGPVNLTTLGIGAIIGAGIFVLTGQAAAEHAGPAIVFVIHIGGNRLRAGRALLRRIRRHDSDLRIRLHLRVCNPWRIHRVDHRLGFDS